MRLSAPEIEQAFRHLLDGSRTREEIAAWAIHAIHEDDADILEFEPQSDEERLRRALHYLAGVDLRDAPDSYLHVEKDFEDFLNRWKSGSEKSDSGRTLC